jgi:imidazolonepropionase-like amidohydrolase
MRPIALTLGFLLTSACVGPVAVSPPAAQGSGSRSMLFAGARVIVGDGRVIDNGAFVVHNRLIVRVGRADEIQPPAEAVTVDLQGRTVMPALVNAHSHLGWEKYTSWGSANFTRENLIDHLNRHAYYGVGTVISTGSDREEIALQVQLEQRLGLIGGAHFVPSPGLGTPGGGPNPNFTADKGWWGSAGGLYEVTDPEQARSVVRAEAAKGVQVLKIWVDARDERRGAKVKLSPDISRAILDEARVHDIRVLAHAPTLADHKMLLRAGVRRLIHGPGDVDEEWIALMKQQNAFLIPTVGPLYRTDPEFYNDPFFRDHVSAAVIRRLADPANRVPIGQQAAARAPVFSPAPTGDARVKRTRDLKRIVDAGVHIMLGADAGWGPTGTVAGTYFGYAEHEELAAWVRMGLTPAQAIVAATMHPAEAFGLTDVGTLVPGKSADFIVLQGNPLDDIANLRRISEVWLRGDKVDRDGLRAAWTKQ